MRYDFCTDNYGFRSMEYPEIKELEVGDKIAVCTCIDLPHKIVLEETTVVTPMFWNSNADHPNWEVETDIGFVDIYSIYEVTEL